MKFFSKLVGILSDLFMNFKTPSLLNVIILIFSYNEVSSLLGIPINVSLDMQIKTTH